MRATDLLMCPVCGAGMISDGKSLFCVGERRHLFDFASSGYVNLLPPGRGKNAHTGDDKTMIAARAAFLDKGYYSPVSERIGEIISDRADGGVSFGDFACGEGYHTCNIAAVASSRGLPVSFLAFDASKHGAAKGAKRAARLGGNVDPFFAAANIFSLPVKDSSLDFAVSIFAPVAHAEMRRVLKDGGTLIVASSGERHLYELRELLYDEPREASGEVVCGDGFDEIFRGTVTYTASVGSREDLKNLFYMTPFYYKTSVRDAAKLDTVDSLDVTVEVKLTLFRKTG